MSDSTPTKPTKQDKTNKSIKDQIAEFKEELCGLDAINRAKLKKYGKTHVMTSTADVEKMSWDVFEGISPDELLVIASYNPNNCRFELDFYKVHEEVYKEINYTARSTNKQITAAPAEFCRVAYLLHILGSPRGREQQSRLA